MTDILARQRQLIGTTAQWALNDLIIGEGEFALELTTSGKVRTKIGNGVDVFSDLAYNLEAGGAFGSGYAWENVTASRADNFDHTSPDHPIMVNYSVLFSTSAGTLALVVGGVSIAAMGNGGNGQMIQTMSAIVPPGTVYRVTTGGAAVDSRTWCELRAD